MFTLRRSAWIRWLPPMDSASPSPVITQTDRSGREVAKTADVGVDEIVVHDAHNADSAYAFALSRLSEQNLEHTVMGIFRQVNRPTYDDAARAQVRAAQESKASDGAALQSLLHGRDTWTVN